MILRGALTALLCVAAYGCSDGDDGAASTDRSSTDRTSTDAAAAESVAAAGTASGGEADDATVSSPPATSTDAATTSATGAEVDTTDPADGEVSDSDDLDDVTIAVPSGDLEVGATDAFVVTSNGTLYWHPALLSGTPQDPVPIALVDEGNEVRRVAGVVDGSVVFGSCCTPAAGEVAAATGAPGPSTRLSAGSAPALSPDGAQLAIVGETALSVVDLTTGDGRTRRLDDTDEVGAASDILWLDDRGPVALVTIDDGYALVRVDPDALSFGEAVPIGVPDTPSAHVELAGAGPNGEIAVATSTGSEVQLRAFDLETLEEDESLTRALPEGVRSVRVTPAGELLWVDGDTLWHTPADESVPVPLGAGSAAAWFASVS